MSYQHPPSILAGSAFTTFSNRVRKGADCKKEMTELIKKLIKIHNQSIR